MKMRLPRSWLLPKPQVKSPPSSVSHPQTQSPISDSLAIILYGKTQQPATDNALGTSGAQAKQRLDQGLDMVSIITDVAAVSNSFQKELADVKGVAAGAGRAGY